MSDSRHNMVISSSQMVPLTVKRPHGAQKHGHIRYTLHRHAFTQDVGMDHVTALKCHLVYNHKFISSSRNTLITLRRLKPSVPVDTLPTHTLSSRADADVIPRFYVAARSLATNTLYRGLVSDKTARDYHQIETPRPAAGSTDSRSEKAHA